MSEDIQTLHDIQAHETRSACIPAEIHNTLDLIRRGAAQDPARPALTFFLRTQDYGQPFVWTHEAWTQQIVRAANMFRALGVERDSVVAYLLPNLPETHWVIWGGEAAGIVMAINPLLEPATIAELLRAARPKVLVTLGPTPGTDLWDKIPQAIAGVESLEHILTVSPLHYLRSAAAPVLRWISRWKTPRRLGTVPVHALRNRMRTANPDRLGFPAPGLDDVASYFCTGGTTGLPKIAVRTHRTEVANALQVAAVFGPELQGEGKSLFCGLPLFHVNAQIGTGLTPWSSGGHVVLGTPQGYRAPGLLQQFWDIAAHFRLVSFSGVPTVYAALLQFPPKGQDISSLRFGICGAAPMPIELFTRFQNETGIKVVEGYGLTEGGCVSSLNPPHGETRFGSIGMRMPWQEMRVVIVDEAGQWLRDAEVDESGVIAIRGPNLFKGYLDPHHNKGLWLHSPAESDNSAPWLNTGDLGRVDAQGYFWLTGRKKELIIRGGHNIDPKSIEEVLATHPAVALAAAIGRPDAHAGEIPVAYVQLRPGHTAAATELLEHATARISERAALPKHMRILPALPVTAVGKIFKPALSQMEIEDVVRSEVQSQGIELTHLDVYQDARRGFVVRWSAQAMQRDTVAQTLGRYTFVSEEISA